MAYSDPKGARLSGLPLGQPSSLLYYTCSRLSSLSSGRSLVWNFFPSLSTYNNVTSPICEDFSDPPAFSDIPPALLMWLTLGIFFLLILVFLVFFPKAKLEAWLSSALNTAVFGCGGQEKWKFSTCTLEQHTQRHFDLVILLADGG